MDIQSLKGESNILFAQLIFGNLVFILSISYILIHHKYSQLIMLHFITLTHLKNLLGVLAYKTVQLVLSNKITFIW